MTNLRIPKAKVYLTNSRGTRRRRIRGRRKVRRNARRWRKGVGQKRSRERKEEKEGSCEEGATINERMVGRRVGWIRFHKISCGLPVHTILAQNEIENTSEMPII